METRHTKQTGIMIYGQTVYNVTLKRNETGWSHYDCNDGFPGHRVGPWYKTKAEILADHESYLIRSGWMKP